MGSSSNESNSLIVIMKYLALVLAIALFAIVSAEAEADADAAAYYYGHYGHGYGHRYGYGYGLGYGHGYGYGYPSRYHGYYGHHLGKRSADAEAAPAADADAAALYFGHYRGYAGYPYAYGAYSPYHAGYYAHPYAVAGAVSHQHVSTPAATYGVHQIHKREAEAAPEADADAAAYYGLHYPGVAGHPGAATSYTHRSVQGASYFPYRGYYGRYYGHGYGYGYPYFG